MKNRVTFSKMDHDPREGTGTIDIHLDGEYRGHIEKESEAEEVGSVSYAWKYTAYSYTVTCFLGEDDDLERCFAVSDYNGPRAALAAAKQWARDTLL